MHLSRSFSSMIAHRIDSQMWANKKYYYFKLYVRGAFDREFIRRAISKFNLHSREVKNGSVTIVKLWHLKESVIKSAFEWMNLQFLGT